MHEFIHELFVAQQGITSRTQICYSERASPGSKTADQIFKIGVRKQSIFDYISTSDFSFQKLLLSLQLIQNE